MKPMKVIVLIEKGPTSYGAYSPDVPGCYAGGQTREEVISLLQEALQTHIDFLIETHRPLPWALRKHIWTSQLHGMFSWIRKRLHHKEEIAYLNVAVAS